MKTKSILLALTLLAFMSQSCDDYLNEELVSDVSASSYYTTPAGLEDAVDATYGYLKYIYGPPERGFTMNTFGTDVHTNGADGSHKVVNWYDNNFNASQGMVRETWRYCYQGINQANAVLNRAQSIEGLDENTLAGRLAEVRFIRAFWYFYLVQQWGDVHLSLEETEGVEVEANKTPASEIYATAIIPDLQAAIADLPAEQSDYGRATKGAAEFMLAKVYLTRAYKSYAESGDAAAAESLMTNVINNYGYALQEDFGDLFDYANQKNSEVIWSVQNTSDLILNGDQGNRGHLYFLMEYDKLPGMQRDTENGRPWKRFRPTDFSLSLWDRDIDSRYDKSYKHVWYSNFAGNIPTWTDEDQANGYGIAGEPKFQVGDTAVYIPGPGKDAEWPAARKAATRYNVYTSDQYTERLYPSLSKFLDPYRPDRQWEKGSRDFVVARLADAYMIRAEARLKQGNNAQGAADDINAIRRRAAWPGMETAMEINAGDVTLDFILDERAREFDGEMLRWFDLVRTGKLVERVRLHNNEAKDNIQDFHVVRPIPQEQIDRTLGGYPQNCGYPGSTCG
jgi:starch-binding outer membrane protein, SusD/RagB family